MTEDKDREPGDRDTPEVALSTLVDAIEDKARNGHGDVASLIRAAGDRGLLQIMTFAGIVLVSPLSGIPFMSSFIGLIICFCALRAIFGKRTVWVPEFVARQEIAPPRIMGAMGWLRGTALWLEARASRRLSALSTQPMPSVFLSLAAIYGGIMPLAEFVPFSSSVLGLGVALIGIGLMLRDGVVLLASLMPPLIVGFLIWSVWQN